MRKTIDSHAQMHVHAEGTLTLSRFLRSLLLFALAFASLFAVGKLLSLG